jgi:hypothetical protein
MAYSLYPALLFKYSRFLLQSVRRDGLCFCLADLASEIHFDLHHGTRTLTPREPTLSDLSSESQTDAVQYQGSSPRLFRRLVETLPSEAFRAHFVDFGSGKGRTLILALEAGFQQVTGIEFSAPLVSEARSNLDQCGTQQPQILQQDATTFLPPPGPLVAFLYNPFRGETLQKVIRNLARHACQAGSQTWVLYINPTGFDSFLQAGFAETARITHRNHLQAVQLAYPSAEAQLADKPEL